MWTVEYETWTLLGELTRGVKSAPSRIAALEQAETECRQWRNTRNGGAIVRGETLRQAS